MAFCAYSRGGEIKTRKKGRVLRSSQILGHLLRTEGEIGKKWLHSKRSHWQGRPEQIYDDGCFVSLSFFRRRHGRGSIRYYINDYNGVSLVDVASNWSVKQKMNHYALRLSYAHTHARTYANTCEPPYITERVRRYRLFYIKSLKSFEEWNLSRNEIF